MGIPVSQSRKESRRKDKNVGRPSVSSEPGGRGEGVKTVWGPVGFRYFETYKNGVENGRKVELRRHAVPSNNELKKGQRYRKFNPQLKNLRGRYRQKKTWEKKNKKARKRHKSPTSSLFRNKKKVETNRLKGRVGRTVRGGRGGGENRKAYILDVKGKKFAGPLSTGREERMSFTKLKRAGDVKGKSFPDGREYLPSFSGVRGGRRKEQLKNARQAFRLGESLFEGSASKKKGQKREKGRTGRHAKDQNKKTGRNWGT